MLKIITQKKRPTIEDIYLTGSGTSLMPLPIFYICTFYYICVNSFIYIYAKSYIYMLSDYLITGRKTPYYGRKDEIQVLFIKIKSLFNFV